MSAELALQGAIVAALKGAAGVTTLVASRVYDRVPEAAPLPYVHLRETQAVDDGASCNDGLEVFAEIDAWSQGVGRPEASRIAGAVRTVLHEAELTLATPFRLVDLQHRSTNIATEGGLLTRARMTFVALVESE